MSGTEQIVTEIIVDTRGAVKGTADYELMLRAVERTAKNTAEQLARNNAAMDASGKSAKNAADILATTSAGYRRAVQATNDYLGRLDPLTFALNALGKETEKVGVAQLGLDKMRLQGKVTEDQLTARTAILTARTKELQGAMEQARAGTLSATDALTFLKTASERASEAVKPLVVANDSLRLKYDEVYRISKQYENSINAIIQAEKDKTISSTLAAQAMEKERLVMEASIATANKAAAGPTAADKAAEYDKLRASIDPVFRLSKEYEAELMKIDAAQKTLNLSTDHVVKLQEDARLNFEKQVNSLNSVKKGHDDLGESQIKAGASAGQMKFANQQLTVQMSQMISGIASGQPVLTTFIQQGHQIFDVAISSGTGLGVFRSAFNALISPIGLVVTGVVAVIGTLAAFALSAEHHQQELLDIQQHLRATQDSYKALGQTVIEVGRQVAGTSTLSRTDATSAASAFASSPRFAGSKQELADLVRIAEDAARVLGIGVPEAAKKFSDAMAGPSAVVQEFADKGLLGFNQKMADSIDLIERTQGKAAAYAEMMKQVQSATKGAAEEGMTPLGKAWNNFLNSFSKFGDAAKPFSDAIGTTVLDAITRLVDGLTAVVNDIREIIDLIPKIPAPPQWLMDFIKGRLASAATFGLTDIHSMLFSGGPAGPTQAPASLAPSLLSSAALNNIDPELLTRLQAAEGVFKNGQWQISPTGAVGPMQVLPSTFAGMLRQPGNYPGAQGLTDLSNPTQNVAAGAAYFAYLLRKYTDVTLAVLAYHEGETKMDAILAGRAQASQEGLDEARKVLAGYKGTGLVAATASTTLPDVVVTASKVTGADISDAQKLANSVDAFKKAHDETLKLQHAFDLLKTSGEGTTEQLNALTLAIEASRKAEYDAVGPVAAAVREHDLQTSMLKKVGEAYLISYAAVQKATIATQAYAEATKLVAPGTSEHIAATTLLTEAITRETQARIDNATAAKNLDTQQQIDFIKFETATLNDNVEVRARELAIYKQKQELQKSGANLDSAASRQALAYAAALADANTQLQINSQALQEIGNLGTQVFDQVGNAITQAFVGGQGAAVNFGNVAKAVMTSVLQEMLKLAILNPILNSLVGGANRTTLDQVIGALGGAAGGGGGGSATGGSSLISMASQGSSVLSGGSSLLQGLGYQGLGGQVNALFGGPGTSLFAGTGLGNVGSGVSALLNTGTGIGFTPTFSVAGAEQLLGTPAGSLAGGVGGATIGSLLGGIGGGFALGSLSGSLIQGSMGKVGPAPMIGAGVGAVGGALIGSFIPVIGTVIGGIIGGLLGGSGGGLIGPKAPSTYSGTQIMVDESGRLTVGKSSNQGTVSNRNDTVDAVKALNDFTAATNIAVTSLGGLTQLGVGTGADKAANLESAFPRLRFTSTDRTLADNIANRSFATSQELQDAVNRILQMEAALKDFTTVVKDTDAAKEVDRWAARFGALGLSAADYTATLTNIATFVTQTVPSLLSMNNNIGSLEAGIKGLNDQFTNALVTAKDLGYKEKELTATRDVAIQRLRDAAAADYASNTTSLTNRIANAMNRLNGASPDVLRAQTLTEFDQQAALQRAAVANHLKEVYGDAVVSTKMFADQMALEDQALYYDRLLVARQFDDAIVAQDKAAADQRLQAAGTAAQAVAALSQYAIGLQTSAASPLSPQDQLTLARSRFNAVSGAAAAGDFNSLQQLQQYADTFLGASRVVYGSGAAYVSDFQRVLDALNSVASVSPDTLTASVLQTETRTQTAELVQSLADLKEAVGTVTAQLRQNAQAPGRIAA